MTALSFDEKEKEKDGVAFQSTSTMKGSGSAYSATPALSADGSAEKPGEEEPAKMPSRPRRIDVYTPTTDPNAPIGDAVLPLMLMAMAFGVVVYLRRRKEVQA